MRRAKPQLAGAAKLQPLDQGDLTNLCGLYSVLNAIQLACWPAPPTRPQLRELYADGVRHLSKRRQLKRVLTSGMEQDVWLALANDLLTAANQLLGASLALSPITSSWRPALRNAKSPDVLLAELSNALMKNRPVLCTLGGALDHYTVVSGTSANRVTLFDSTGLKWIERRSIGAGEHGGKRHWLYAALAVVEEW